MKKLNAKHFRYLSKNETKNPLAYLDYLYNSQTNFAFFKTEIDLFLQTGLDPRLKVKGIDYSYTAQLFIKQIEIAYIFYKNCAPKKHANANAKIKSVQDRHLYLQNIKSLPLVDIEYVFSLMSLKRWYEELDYMTCTASSQLKKCYFELHEDAMLIYIYGLRFVDALYQIYKEGGLQLSSPYVKNSIGSCQKQ